MEKRKRKTYCKPKFYPIELDKEISLLMYTDENNPPGPPLSSSESTDASSSDETTKEDDSFNKSEFEDNPFQR